MRIAQTPPTFRRAPAFLAFDDPNRMFVPDRFAAAL
jgi:hypothetical protein